MFKGLSLAVVWIVLTIQLVGCAALIGATAGGVGTALWLSGKLTDEVRASYEKTIDSAEKALHSLDMKVIEKTQSEKITQIKGETQEGKIVWIDITPLAPQRSKVDVRVGVTGDKAASTEILEEIKDHIAMPGALPGS